VPRPFEKVAFKLGAVEWLDPKSVIVSEETRYPWALRDLGELNSF
jgi:hypothetical protein